VWDGEKVSVLLEMHSKVFALTVINADKSISAPAIPVDVLREELTQFDIRTDHILVFTMGHKFARQSMLSTVCHSVTGPIPVLLKGRTFVEVSVRLAGSLDSVSARSGKDSSVPVGLSKTVQIAAARVRRRLEREGWRVTTLTRSQLQKVSDSAMDTLVPMMRTESWGRCGTASMSITAHTPTRGSWNQDSYQEWNQFSVHRQLSALRISRNNNGTDQAEVYFCYTDPDPHAMDLAEAVGLRKEYGQQGDVLTAMIPTAKTADLSEIPSKSLRQKEPFPFQMYPCGAGVFVGFGDNRSQVFADLSYGGSAPLYVVSPAAYMQQLVIRALATGSIIDVRVHGDIWKSFVTRIKAPEILGYDSIPDADIVVAPENDIPDQDFPGQTIIAWTETAPRIVPESIIVVTNSGSTVVVRQTKIPFQWTTTTGEARLITAPVGRKKTETDEGKETPETALAVEDESPSVQISGKAPSNERTTTEEERGASSIDQLTPAEARNVLRSVLERKVAQTGSTQRDPRLAGVIAPPAMPSDKEGASLSPEVRAALRAALERKLRERLTAGDSGDDGGDGRRGRHAMPVDRR
jgi:type VII secretion protein EccE